MEVLDIDGESLLPLLKGKPVRDAIFMESIFLLRAIRTPTWNLIHNLRKGSRDTIELYNVENDPVEAVNLTDTDKQKTGELVEKLDYWVKTNLRDEKKDPIIDDQKELSLGQVKYQEKIAVLLKALSGKLNGQLGAHA